MPPVEQRPSWWSDPTGWLREGIEEKRGLAVKDQLGRRPQEGIIDQVVGDFVGADDGTEYRDAAKEHTFKGQITALEGKWIPGQTTEQYEAEVRRLTKLRDNSEAAETPQGKALQAGIDNNTTQLIQSGKRIDAQIAEATATRETAEERFKYLESKDDKRFALQNAQRLDDKAEARRERLDMLDRQDHRYDQQMERYDKRRRQESIQGLVGGLAALGAAFAI